MYRIEVRPGEETVFRTIEELATGIRNGFITPRARIYHAASQKWLPIEFHPHYKKALDGDFTPTPQAPQPSLAAMPAPSFAFPSTAPAPAPSSRPTSPVAPADSAPVITAPSSERAPASSKVPPSATTAAESPVLAMRAAVRRTPSAIEEADADGPVERYSPVAVVAPRRAPAKAEFAPAEVEESPAPVAVLDAPRLAPVPEVVLPNITYPEVLPMEPEQRATARRSRRTAGRPLLLIGSAAALVLGGQRYLAGRGAAAGATPVAEAVAPEPAESAPPARPASSTPPAVTRSAQVAPQRPASVPAPAQRMQPGPAFAASVPAGAAAAAPTTPPPAASVAPSLPPDQAPHADAVIAPAPTAIELDLPAALPGESIAPAVDEGRDSLAIKRILKAVTGRKANPTAP